MKTLQINTSQNVKINFTIANIGDRFLAFASDNILKFAYVYIAFNYLNLFNFENSLNDQWSVRAMDVLVFLPITFYSLYSEILMNGQTIGKKILKIKVVNVDGYKPSNADYLIRWFLRTVDFNIFTLLFVYIASLGLENNLPLLLTLFFIGKLTGIICISLTKNNQRFGDIAANTIVISLKDTIKFSHTILENISAQYIPSYPNVIKLSDNDARIIKDTYRNAVKSNDHATMIKLRNKIEQVTKIKSIAKSDADFIDKILKDYNYYTQQM